VEDESEIEQLKDLLFLNLEEHGGIGLSANQLGIDRRMCVVNVREPFAMVNPELVAMGGRTVYIESCLSFPSQRMKTERYVEVEVQCDNYDGTLVFGPEPDSFEPETVEDLDDPMILESVAVQHEIDHLNGVTIHDRKATANQPASANDYGRNDVVVFERGSESVEIKWKHRNKLEEGFEPVGRP
jgi:peptide deformylase